MTREELLEEMDALGYHYNDFDSYDDWIVFDTGLGRISWESWEELQAWYDGGVFYSGIN